jgi:hypothetical protein
MDNLKDVEVVRPLPKKFLYRGDIIFRDKITPELAQIMAKDKKFHSIQPKAQAPAKPEKGGPNEEGKK